MEDFFQIGVISSTHGIKGEVKVFPTTDEVNRFKKLKEVYLDTGKERLILHPESVKFFKQFVILKFKEFNDINEIEQYRNKSLLVDREHAVKLKKDEYFIADLIGLKVMTDEGEQLGILKDVLQTGANDVYIVETSEGKEVLLPAIKECVLKVDVEAGEVLVHIMPGLLD
ncbi:MAG: 16S rRNA processing protein RimM [Lachnospiraceae bacterium]|nr:16S rRNA processing protein RimM [Lachnospiraceae bacterium]